MFFTGNSAALFTLVFSRERQWRGRRNGLIGCTLLLSDDSIAAGGVLGIFMTRKVLGSLSDVSRDTAIPTKIIAEQENIFGKTVKNVIPP